VCSRTTPPFSTPARTPGENFSQKKQAASPQSHNVTGSSSVNLFEGWYYLCRSSARPRPVAWVRRAARRTDRLQPACARNAGKARPGAGVARRQGCWFTTTIWKPGGGRSGCGLRGAQSGASAWGTHGSPDADLRRDHCLCRAIRPSRVNRPKPDDHRRHRVFLGHHRQAQRHHAHPERRCWRRPRAGQVVMGPITPDSAALLYMQPSFAAWADHRAAVRGRQKPRFVSAKLFTPTAFLQACQPARRITKAPLVPTMWADGVRGRSGKLRSLIPDTGVDLGRSAGAERHRAALPTDLQEHLLASIFSGEGIHCIGRDGQHPRPDRARNKIGSSGRPVVGADVKILDPRWEASTTRPLLARPARSRSPGRRWPSATGRTRN